MNSKLPFLDALKQGILLERKGKVFYQVAASQTENQTVKDFFTEMAAEETFHDRFLTQIYSNYNHSGVITKMDFSDADIRKASRVVISADLIAQISSAGYEAAAIAAAIEMEKRSIELYSTQADNATDENEQLMFTFLKNWENEHLSALIKIDADIREKVWYDNKFWSF